MLVIDDEEAIRFAFSEILAASWLHVDTADSLEAAAELISQKPYRCAVVDLRLSGTNAREGFEAVKMLRKHNRDCKIIVLTAYARDGAREQAFSSGADYFMEKPTSPLEVRDVFQSLGAL